MSEPIKAEAPSGEVTGSIERESITPEQFMAEMEAAGVAGKPEGDPDKTPVIEKPADGEPPADKVEAPAEGEAPAEVEAKDAKAAEVPAVEEKPPEAKADDTPEIKAARKIYNAAARKEAQALRVAQENKQLKGTIDQLTKLRDEDPLALLQALGFGAGAEKEPIKDLLGRIVSKGEKPAPTLEEKVAALEAQLANEKSEASKRAETQTVEAAKVRVVEAVKTAGEKFDLVNSLEEHDQVLATMEAYYAKHGVAIDSMLAAEHVEKHLAAKLGRSTKFKAPGPAAQAAKPGTTSNGNKPTSAATGKSETLTNTDSGRTEPADEFSMDDHDARAKQVAKSLGLGFIRN